MIANTRDIFKTEGINGFFRGYSATFYSSIISGFVYFYIYKHLKLFLKDKIDNPNYLTMIYAAASWTAESFALLVYYPYELVRVRMLTMN